MEGRYARGEVFSHEFLPNLVTLYQVKQKRLKIEVFERIGVAIFTHRHTCINKPCWESVDITIFLYCLKLTVQLFQRHRQYFVCVFVYFLCNIIRNKGETEKEKLCYRNIDVYKYFGIKIDILVKIDIAYLEKGFQLHQSLHRSCQP